MDNLIFLIGFMGCGKTYWGKRISDQTGIPFLDLDQLIESRSNDTIPRLFEHLGETEFRVLERSALHACEGLGTVIIATGGGTPCHFDNMDWMNEKGRTIYLDTPVSLLTRRLRQEQHLRPLLKGIPAHLLEKRIEALIAQRAPFYARAQEVLQQTGEANEAFGLSLEQIIVGKN